MSVRHGCVNSPVANAQNVGQRRTFKRTRQTGLYTQPDHRAQEA